MNGLTKFWCLHKVHYKRTNKILQWQVFRPSSKRVCLFSSYLALALSHGKLFQRWWKSVETHVFRWFANPQCRFCHMATYSHFYTQFHVWSLAQPPLNTSTIFGSFDAPNYHHARVRETIHKYSIKKLTNLKIPKPTMKTLMKKYPPEHHQLSHILGPMSYQCFQININTLECSLL